MATATEPFIWGTGRRKTAVARVRIREGTGPFMVNELEVDKYFLSRDPAQRRPRPARTPPRWRAGSTSSSTSRGAASSSQSGAVLLGLARALKEHRPDLEPALRQGEFLTRDSRKVERKKYGHKKARKSFQFSKR